MPLPKVHEIGRLFADVELRYTPSGRAVCAVPIVFSKRVKDKETGEWSDAGAMFVRATAWEKLAEHCANSLSKGDEVLVHGELSMREYDKKDGSGKGQSLEMNLHAIGVSLKWNEVKILRAERSSGRGNQEDDPWSTAAPTGTDTQDPFDDSPPF